MLKFGLFGAGRIGVLHGRNIARHPRAELAFISDPVSSAAEDLAAETGAQTAAEDAILADPSVDAVAIASSTDTHADLIEAAARAGKAIFCEKPVDLDSGRAKACLEVVAECGVPLAIGFNRRFDPNFLALHRALREGQIGKLELVSITSHDPGPPPIEYVRRSGGLFRDFAIHDLDMARWLLGEEPVEVFAAGSCLVDPAIGQAGDIDTAVTVLKTASGVLCQISNSRRATYGYDQRIEVLGSGGMLRAGNPRPTTLEQADDSGYRRDRLMPFFMERYAEAYRLELTALIEALESGQAPAPTGDDGLRALLLADAAARSLDSGQPVRF
jgi:myo-inositol 2-dehydrogenase/D-chiro-inositol 1-dehydrogenase